MTLTLKREPTTDDATLGKLYINDIWICYTLEDAVHAGAKVQGETAIPAGRYQVVINRSQRFGRMLPLLLDVPGFQGIRMHGGNTIADTAGCILVGFGKVGTTVTASQAALQDVMSRIAEPLAKGEQVWIDVVPARIDTTEVVNV